MPTFPYSQVVNAAEHHLRSLGATDRDAVDIVDHLATADRWGRHSHGLSIRYPLVAEQVAAGALHNHLETLKDGGSWVSLDGQNSIGYLSARRATDLLTSKLGEQPLCLVGLRGARHTGMLGYYVDRLASSGFVAMACSHCTPLMAPHGGTRALLGTNPLAFGFPAEPHPLIIDMGTAEMTYGEIRQHQEAGDPLPAPHALDKEGTPTTDPDAVLDGGCLLPFGGHRGGALAIAVQLLAGLFTGADVFPPKGEGYGLLILGCHKGLFAGAEAYDSGMETFIRAYQAMPAQPGYEVRLPGRRTRAAAGDIQVSLSLQTLLQDYL